jgi:hypothetical protein
METVKPLAVLIAAMIVATGTANAGDEYPWDDLWAPYSSRHDKATATSGNAQDVNSVTQIISPWPPGVADRHIPGDGGRMVGAVKRYRDPRGLGASTMPQLTTPPTGGQSSGNASTNGQASPSGNSGQAER